MIDMASIQARDKDRARHDQMIAEFLSAGGKIEVLEHIERQPIRQPVWNGGITHDCERRKAFLELERNIAEHGRALAATGLTVEQAVRQLRQRWGSQCSITIPKAEQIAARFGYSYSYTGRGRP